MPVLNLEEVPIQEGIKAAVMMDSQTRQVEEGCRCLVVEAWDVDA